MRSVSHSSLQLHTVVVSKYSRFALLRSECPSPCSRPRISKTMKPLKARPKPRNPRTLHAQACRSTAAETSAACAGCGNFKCASLLSLFLGCCSGGTANGTRTSSARSPTAGAGLVALLCWYLKCPSLATASILDILIRVGCLGAFGLGVYSVEARVRGSLSQWRL
jgi:hypothetical protein